MTKEKLEAILEKHRKWLNDEEGGERANLEGVDLSKINLKEAMLSKANLSGVDLTQACLKNAYLLEANLRFAHLINANLAGADLSGANLRGANLTGADLTGAYLSKADLSNATLTKANLTRAILRGTCLQGTALISTNLTDTDLIYTNLTDANLKNAVLVHTNLAFAILNWTDLRYTDLEYINLEGDNLLEARLSQDQKVRLGVCLKEPMVGYKKCWRGTKAVIVTLLIPKGAIVFSINGNKCRTNVAKVIDIDDGLEEAVSGYDKKFIYHKGKKVSPDHFDCAYNVECGGGIHFFRTREEAEDYMTFIKEE